MKKKVRLWTGLWTAFLVMATLLIGHVGTTWGVNGKNSLHAEDELIVRFHGRASQEDAEAVLKSHGTTEADEITGIRVKRIKVPAHAREKVKEALSRNPHIELVEDNFIAEGHFVPNDSLYASEWHLPKIKAPEGWDLAKGSFSVPIAIIDSGVYPTHPDLAGKLLAGYNFLTDTTVTADVLGHGTSTAGTAAASSNNALGVAGIAWENPIMPLVVLNSSNAASYYNIARAIVYAVDNGVKVINISIGGGSNSITLQDAVNYAWNHGALVFASAGNYNTDAPIYPAACVHAVAVSATTSTDTKAGFSSYGDWVDIAAPGNLIYTTKSGGTYGYVSGTSFSSPMTAGLAALVWSENPNLTNEQLYYLLLKNSDDLGTVGFDNYFGWGRINAQKSIAAALTPLPMQDTNAPIAYVASPMNADGVLGTTTVNVEAVDDNGIERVELYVDGVLYSALRTSPYNFQWDTKKYPDGIHSIQAIAYDYSFNSGMSNIRKVGVGNYDTIAPAVSVTAPLNGSTVTGKLNITGKATDNVMVKKIEILIDGAVKSSKTLTTAVNAYPSSYYWDTSTIATGAHTLSVRAYDEKWKMSTSTITVYK